MYTHAAYGEHRVLVGLLEHLNLPKPTLEVHDGEISGAH